MKRFRNHTTRHLTPEEHQAVLDMADVLERGFNKKVHTVMVNPNNDDPTDVFGLAIGFDKGD